MLDYVLLKLKAKIIQYYPQTTQKHFFMDLIYVPEIKLSNKYM